MTDERKHYRAFISYSQKDGVWGRRLHSWLETYRVPLGVMVDVDVSRRLGRFFRDEEEMAAAANIADTVRGAIEAAESLIVICSPRSAKSEWVNAEILHFRRTGRGGQVFAFIIDGVPNSGDPATECFPPALRAAGDPNDPDALPIEPLGLDIRKDGKQRACARLAAGMLGADFDDLWRRDRRRAERIQRLVVSGLSALSLVLAALTATAVVFGLQAQHRAAILSIDSARTILQEGDADGALLLLLEAAKSFSAASAPDTLLIAFDEALQRAASEDLYPLPQGARVFDAPGGLYIVDPERRAISLLDSRGPPRVIVEAMGSPAIFVGQAADGALLVVREDLEIERRRDGAAEMLGAFANADVRALVPGRYAGVPLADITLSADGVLLLQDCWDCEQEAYRVQAFDTVERRLHAIELRRNNRLDGRAYYARAPDGRRIVFSAGDMRALDGSRLDDAPSRLDMMASLCGDGARLPAEVAAALARTGFDFLEPVHCAARDGAVLLSVATRSRAYYSPDGRSDYLFKPEDPIDNHSIQSWVHSRYLASPDFSYVSGGLRGNAFAEVAAVDYDQASRTLAVAFGRDLMIGGRERMLEWRMPNLVARVRLLADDKLAVIDLDGRFVHVVQHGSPHLYATRRLSEEERGRYFPTDLYLPSEEAAPVCSLPPARLSGAAVTVTESAPLELDEPRMAAIRIAGPRGGVERRFEIGFSCVRLSANAQFAAYIDPLKVAHVLDLRRLLAGEEQIDIGAINGVTDIAFSGAGREIVVVRPGGMDAEVRGQGLVIARMAPAGDEGAWSDVAELYRGTASQQAARLDERGRRAILLEQLASEDDFGGEVYSLEAQRTWRRLGAAHRWFNAGFTTGGEAFTFNGFDENAEGIAPEVLAITLHDLPQAIAAAREALSQHCRDFRGDDFRASQCWRRSSGR